MNYTYSQIRLEKKTDYAQTRNGSYTVMPPEDSADDDISTSL